MLYNMAFWSLNYYVSIYKFEYDNHKIKFIKKYRDTSGIIKVGFVGTILIRESISLSY
jgi:hypothetical protein